MELYIHIPFCRQKCRYCSFTSFTACESDYEAYIALLLKEAENRRGEACEPVRTAYIGGGTPSLLPPFLFRKLLSGLRDIYDFSSLEEFTSEANPGTVTAEWLEASAETGINRLSFGMQAGQDVLLQQIGRIHRYGDVLHSVALARKVGFGNISLDLIFGIPGQTRKQWSETLEAALSLHPEHISAYGLIPEPGTPLFSDLESGLLSLPEPEEEREMYDEAIHRLDAGGFHQYEISNFARKGFECLHNIGYWTQVPYIGLGVSAASMTMVKKDHEGMSCVRRTNPESIQEYRKRVLSGDLSGLSETIPPCETRFETMLLGLRMNSGVSEASFAERHGVTLEACYGKRLEQLASVGLAVHENGTWKLTRRGFDVQNSVLVELMD